jgi:hypothetical protein
MGTSRCQHLNLVSGYATHDQPNQLGIDGPLPVPSSPFCIHNLMSLLPTTDTPAGRVRIRQRHLHGRFRPMRIPSVDGSGGPAGPSVWCLDERERLRPDTALGPSPHPTLSILAGHSSTCCDWPSKFEGECTRLRVLLVSFNAAYSTCPIRQRSTSPY